MIRKKTNKTLMPKKSHNRINVDDFETAEGRRDTKNIPRNIVRAFINVLTTSGNQSFELVEQLAKEKHYNNSLVEAIINNQELTFLFRDFLSSSARKWIDQSRIKDKQSHYEAIDIYLAMIEDHCPRNFDDVFDLQ